MDMDQLRKINQLSSELKRHGMAGSSTDAYQQAEEIIQVTHKPAPVEQGESVVVEQAPADPLVARQFAVELERMQKEHAVQLDVLRNAMNQLIAEVNSLRDEFSKAQSEQPPKQKEKQAELKTENKEPHPRQGHYKPGDIDIKSVFYFGTKK